MEKTLNKYHINVQVQFIGGVTGGVIGNQMVKTADADNNIASNNRDVSNNTNSINEKLFFIRIPINLTREWKFSVNHRC